MEFLDYPLRMNMVCFNRLARGCAVVAAILVLGGSEAQAGQKVRYSSRSTPESTEAINLKTTQSFAPENLGGIKTKSEVQTDIIPIKVESVDSPAMEKRRRQLAEDRADWLGANADARKAGKKDGKEDLDEKSQFEKDDDSELRDSKRDETRKERRALTPSELNRFANPNDANANSGVIQEQRDFSAKGGGTMRANPLTGGLLGTGTGDGELKAAVTPGRNTAFTEEREAMRKAETDRFKSLFNQTPGGVGGNGSLNNDGSFRAGGLSVPGQGLGSSGLGPSAPGVPRGFSDFGGARGPGGFNFNGPGGSGMGQGFDNQNSPLRQAPKPLVLPMPKRLN
jgi:hypothetical protein